MRGARRFADCAREGERTQFGALARDREPGRVNGRARVGHADAFFRKPVRCEHERAHAAQRERADAAVVREFLAHGRVAEERAAPF